MTHQLGFNDPKHLLQELIANWPIDEGQKWPKSDAEKQILKTHYSKYLDENFDITDFVARITPNKVTLSDALVTKNFAKILVLHPLGPYLAILRKTDHKYWRLSRFTFQCVTCFGVGIYGDEICNVCGGTGWGTMGDLEFYALSPSGADK